METAKGETDVLNVDKNHRISRTLDRAADRLLGSPLIIRHVAGSDGRKMQVHQEPAAATGTGVNSMSSAEKRDEVSANVKDGQQPESKDHDKKMTSKVVAGAEMKTVNDAKDEARIVQRGVGCDSAGSKFDDFAVMLDHEFSQGCTTNAADQALRVAPFTNASHGVSLMLSEVVGGGAADSDDEAVDGNFLLTGAPTTLSKSPLGSSSSAQLSGHRSVQHMLKQIQDAGERLNERITARDFGARRRLPAVPIDAVDSDMPTSSQSAKSDGSAEAQPEYRPIRSVLEELHRPAIRSPKSLGRSSGCPSATSRQLPDPSAVKHTTSTGNRLTQTNPENLKLSEFAPGEEAGRQLLDLSSAKHSVLLDDRQLSVHDVDVPAEGKQPKKLSECLHGDVSKAECRQLPVTATKPFESETNAETTKFPEHCATENSVTADSCVPAVQSLYDRHLLAFAVDLIASESWLRNLKSSETLDIAPVTQTVGRGMADGESPRNTVNVEAERTVLCECLQSPMMKLSDCDGVPVCEHSSVIPHCITVDNYAANCTSTECFRAEPSAQKIESSPSCAFDQMRPLSSSTVASNISHFVFEDELKCDPKVDAEYVCRQSVVKLPTNPHHTRVTSSDVAELLLSDAQKGTEGHKDLASCDELAAVSVPNTSCLAVNDADPVSDAKPIDASPNMHSENSNVTGQHNVLFLLHNDEHIHNEVIRQNAREKICNSSSVAKTSCSVKSGDETGHDIKLCQETSKPSALTAAVPVAANERNMKSPTCIVSSDNRLSSGVKGEEPFCLAGPRRAICTPNSSDFVSSVSAVIKTGSQLLTTPSTAVNLTGNDVPVKKNDQLTGGHIPVIRSTNATRTSTVSAAAEKHATVSQRKPGNAAVKIGHTALTRVTGFPPPIHLSTHSPQPPTEPASRPAAAAAQARYDSFFAHHHQFWF